ncbi:MAG: hypothetical protein PHE49_11720 [bacterium]|nr:hypothetical protein [bacterium]
MRNAKLLLLAALLLSGCGPKPFLWKGNYISINTAETPKEDFKAGDYILISYAPIELNPKVKIPYKFGIIKGNKQVALVLLKNHPNKKLGTKYSLEETRTSPIDNNLPYPSSLYSDKDKERIADMTSSLPFGEKYFIYKNYVTLPSYDTLKNDIMQVLTGILPYETYSFEVAIDTTIEKPKEEFQAGNYIVVAYAPADYLYDADILYKFAVIMGNRKIGVIFLQHHPEFNVFGTEYFLEETGVRRTGTIPYETSSNNHVTYKSYPKRPDYETIKNDVISVLSK